jgi:hypothetical protein
MNYASHLQTWPPKIIMDTGTTGHYFQLTFPATNITPTTKPIHVTMPNGSTISSTHTGELPIPDLPLSARTVHLFPELAAHSLLSVGMLCDHGCTCKFDTNTITIQNNGKTILTGTRDTNGLWTIALSTSDKPTRCLYSANQATANTLLETTIVRDLTAFLHAACFSPVPSMLVKAINNGHFATWPGFTAHNVQKHLPKSIATTMGHLNQQQQNTLSTKLKPDSIPSGAIPDKPGDSPCKAPKATNTSSFSTTATAMPSSPSPSKIAKTQA